MFSTIPLGSIHSVKIRDYHAVYYWQFLVGGIHTTLLPRGLQRDVSISFSDMMWQAFCATVKERLLVATVIKAWGIYCSNPSA